ncbi:MAG: AzlC family ABC transporter permease [Elainella sp. Prado103]|jgi:4-azaleucine resistance transporter AzlC|nr:AzlC family ABC transporter permease [Elainella sp. Prado103]
MNLSDHRSPAPTARSEFLSGCRAILPLIIGAIPFGIIFGTLATSSGLSSLSALAMSLFVFAGSSQFIALGLLSTQTALPLIILTTFVVNLRHLLYAVSLVPYVHHLPQFWKAPIAFWLTDEAFAVGIGRYHQPDSSPYKHWYYLGGALFMYLNWQLFTWVGLTVGQMMPNAANWGLDFAMSVTFTGMVIPYLTRRPMVVAVLMAGITALLTHGLPHQLGLMVATIVGILAGFVTEQRCNRPSD